MKMINCSIFLILITAVTEAQSNNSLVFGNALVKYKNMERIGTVLAAVGGASLFTGNILYRQSYNVEVRGNAENNSKTFRTLMFAGLGLMSAGIPIWAIGKAKERHITIEAGLVNMGGTASANRIGLKINF